VRKETRASGTPSVGTPAPEVGAPESRTAKARTAEQRTVEPPAAETIIPETIFSETALSPEPEKPSDSATRGVRENSLASTPTPEPPTVEDDLAAGSPEAASVPAESSVLGDGAVRRVGSTTFQIAYQLDDVGPSGVSSVDLY